MNKTDIEYNKVLQKLLDKGKVKSDRTGTGTYSLFGEHLEFSFDEGFPILTGKKVYFNGIKTELLWFLGTQMKDPKYHDLGRTNIKYLVDNNCHIWDEWPYKAYTLTEDYKQTQFTIEQFTQKIKEDSDFSKYYGDIGSGAYGAQWCEFEGFEHGMSAYREMEWADNSQLKGINQIDECIKLLKTNPDSRRILVVAWNPAEIDKCLLPPCHYAFQFYTELISDKQKEKYNNYYGDNKIPERMISIKFEMRSCDYFLGFPFNLASYSLLLAMIAQCVGMIPNRVIADLGDTHLYSNHIEQANLQLSRKVIHQLPTLKLNNDIKNIQQFKLEDIQLENYNSYPTIKAPIAV
jgi:thymidylate synthase